jgi:glutathione synthase/RimK-type ligase-like ATP-grasp enzyme
MKKIGILFGQEQSFPPAFVERVNQKTGGKDIAAEFVRIDKVIQGEPCGYDVMIDRISQDVPFYRAWLKNAALTGTAVVNNPFWWSADDKFFNNALATKIGVAVPRTVLLPSHDLPADTNEKSFRNLGYPLDWESIFNYVGWPAFFKPFSGGGWKNVYRLHNREEFFRAYNDTGQLVMMLQEEIKFDMYFRCYSIDQRHVRIMPYEPRNPFHLRYRTEWHAPKEILQRV